MKVFLGGAYNHKVAMFMIHEISTSRLPRTVSTQPKKKKMEHLDKLISKLTTSTSNGKYQLPTRMSQCATRAQGLMLISIFETHFLQARFSQARLSYGLNSCIILYFILLSMVQVHVTYGRNWVSVVWRVWVGFFRTFCMSLDQACYQVGKGHW